MGSNSESAELQFLQEPFACGYSFQSIRIDGFF